MRTGRPGGGAPMRAPSAAPRTATFPRLPPEAPPTGRDPHSPRPRTV
ncbi:hypothetical protein T261_4754 [Streptomyces lydicus]|nr:hypothetical protein T261_4754 [Streptomyces lydicus]